MADSNLHSRSVDSLNHRRSDSSKLSKLSERICRNDNEYYTAFSKIKILTHLTSFCENGRCATCPAFDNGCLLTEIRNIAEEQLARW